MYVVRVFYPTGKNPPPKGDGFFPGWSMGLLLPQTRKQSLACFPPEPAALAVSCIARARVGFKSYFLPTETSPPHLKDGCRRFWGGQWDLNPQPLVPQTSALPIEL